MTQMMDWFKDLCFQWAAEAFTKCDRCFALVEKEDAPLHISWHREEDGKWSGSE